MQIERFCANYLVGGWQILQRHTAISGKQGFAVKKMQRSLEEIAMLDSINCDKNSRFDMLKNLTTYF